ncbi:hypothetical protein D9758_011224 [Tetrapyrgos nigripes]|uniref:Uncharacterized protein n=1 Tax=Tetrapyrgos nigripes TaxID=182062 RepID=A0A8H5D6L2_9AGAR|nr:hypothetical protein D9758_011224 [Tetrapyrgos nigripes]
MSVNWVLYVGSRPFVHACELEGSVFDRSIREDSNLCSVPKDNVQIGVKSSHLQVFEDSKLESTAYSRDFGGVDGSTLDLEYESSLKQERISVNTPFADEGCTLTSEAIRTDTTTGV